MRWRQLAECIVLLAARAGIVWLGELKPPRIRGWNRGDPLPVVLGRSRASGDRVPRAIAGALVVSVDFAATLRSASDFNRWTNLV